MEEVLWSYAKSIQVGIFSSMADDHPPQGHLMHTSYLTLTYFSRSQQPFLV